MRAVTSALAFAACTDGVTQCSVTPGGPIDGPCVKGNEYCGPAFGLDSPQFHIQDVSCGENDPNFPFLDPKTQLYHHFWQVHLATPPGHGPDIGHAVSKDLVHWAHLPVAVWNDKPYDNEAIFTGSATIVNGVPTMVYPGLCNKNDWPNCGTGTLLAIAVPEDLSDPFLTNWTKPAYNPIVENTQRDPSTAWQTPSGEWRLTNYEGKIFSSTDFVHWSRPADGLTPFPVAECPDFFPVPARCTGNGCDAPAAPGFNPTHVHKHSDGGDWYAFGVYDAGADGTSGTWVPYANTSDARGLPLDASQYLGGSMSFYASKSFFDDAHSRRIYWGWALVPPASTQTLPRVTTYHALLQRLIFQPAPELAELRGGSLFGGSVIVPEGDVAQLSAGWPVGAANSSETDLVIELPTLPATFGLRVWGNSSNVAVFSDLTISFDPVSFSANVTWGRPPPPSSYYMPGVDMPGDDLSVTNVNYTDPRLCQLACNNTPACLGFTYVVRPPLKGSCCLKNGYPNLLPNAACTSGVKPAAAASAGMKSAAIPLLKGDVVMDVAVYIDNTFLEVYIMQGRVALTLNVASGISDVALGLFATGADVTFSGVDVWPLKSIWVPPAEVLRRA